MKKTVLLDYCLNITDGEHCSVENDFNGDYFLLANENIVNGEIFFSAQDRKISKETFEKINKRCQIEKGDVLISTVGTLGKIEVVKEEKHKYVFQRSVGIIKPNPKILDSDYLKYFLSLNQTQKMLLNNSKGAVQKCIFINDLKDLPFTAPSIEKQRKNIKILSDIDDKISNNNKTNHELELVIKTLYNYWFLQFEFPNNEGKPYKSSGGKMVWNEKIKREIPEGWLVENLMESTLCKDIKPGIGKFKIKRYLPTANVNGEQIEEGEEITFTSRESRANMQPTKYSVWFAKMKNSIKHLMIPENSEWFIQKYILSTGFQGIQCSKNTFSYISSIIHSSWFERYKDTISHGATQESVNNEDLKNIKFVVPSKETLQKYSEIVNPILEKKFLIIKENQELGLLRDFLLPVLMNEQATFK